MAGQALCRRSPCPSPPSDGMSIPPDPAPPVPQEASRARRHNPPVDTQTPQQHFQTGTPLPAPACAGTSTAPHCLRTQLTHRPSPSALCLPPHPSPIFLLSSVLHLHGPGTAPCRPRGPGSVAAGRAGGAAPGLGTALRCPISAARGSSVCAAGSAVGMQIRASPAAAAANKIMNIFISCREYKHLRRHCWGWGSRDAGGGTAPWHPSLRGQQLHCQGKESSGP